MSVWKFNETAEKRLKQLLTIPSPFSFEVPMGNYLRRIWNSFNCDVSTDVLGNVYASLPGTMPIHVGLVAHIDTVAIQITQITDRGMLFFRSAGLRPFVLLGQRVEILTAKGKVQGIIGFDPLSQYNTSPSSIEDNLWIDIGTYSEEESSSLVAIGDFAVLKGEYTHIGKSCIGNTGIDNRIGIFIVNECIRWFATKGAPLHLHAIGSVQEEMGLRGATAITNHKQLNACFILDVDYATDTPTTHEVQLGKLSLGKGTGLHKKADNNMVLQRIVQEVANINGLPYQMNLGRHLYGGTDASVIQIQQGGIATINLNIPCRYMHSAIELCNIQDIETTVNLLIAIINTLATSQKHSFIPGID